MQSWQHHICLCYILNCSIDISRSISKTKNFSEGDAAEKEIWGERWHTVWLAFHYNSAQEDGSDHEWGLLPAGLLRKWEKNTCIFIPPCHSRCKLWCGAKKGEKNFSMTCGFCILLHTLVLHHMIMHDRSSVFLSLVCDIWCTGFCDRMALTNSQSGNQKEYSFSIVLSRQGPKSHSQFHRGLCRHSWAKRSKNRLGR